MEVTAGSVFYIEENTEGNRIAAEAAIKETLDREYLKRPVQRRGGGEFLDTVVGMIRAEGGVMAVRYSGGPSTSDLLKGRVKVVLGKKCVKIAKAKARKARKQASVIEEQLRQEVGKKLKAEIGPIENEIILKLKSLDKLIKQQKDLLGKTKMPTVFSTTDRGVLKDLKNDSMVVRGFLDQAKKLELGSVVSKLENLIAEIQRSSSSLADQMGAFVTMPIEHADVIYIYFEEAYNKIGERTFPTIDALINFLQNIVMQKLVQDVGSHGLTKAQIQKEIRINLEKKRTEECMSYLDDLSRSPAFKNRKLLQILVSLYVSLDPAGPTSATELRKKVREIYGGVPAGS